MAVIGDTAYTFADWARRVDGSGKQIGIVELLSQNNQMLNEMLVVEGNLPTGHRTGVRTGLPSGTWRLLNYGILPTKSTVAQITASCGNLEAEAVVDVDLANLNGNTAVFRLSESKAFIQGMSIQMQETVLYGNEGVTPERFTGITPHYSSLAAPSGRNIIDAGGTGSDNTSIWVITWGSDTIHGITPKGKPTGLIHKDKGEHRVVGPNGGHYWAYVDHYKWELGLVVRDWRYAVRIANIDVSDLATVNGANLSNLLTQAMYKLPTAPVTASPIQTADNVSSPMGRTVIYANRTAAAYLDIQAQNKSNLALQYKEWDGGPITTFRGIPIRNVDAILNTEARVV